MMKALTLTGASRGSPIADGRPKRSRGSRPPTIPLRSMRGAAPCISRMSDRSVVWNGTKWLAVKNLEESAELVEACKQYLKASDPTDPSGIDGQFIGVVNCLNIHGAAVGDEPDIDLDKAPGRLA